MSSLAWLTGMHVLNIEVMLAICALVLLLADIIMPHGDKKVLGWVAAAELLLCLVATFVLDLQGSALSEAYFGDPMAVFFKRLFLVSGLVAILGSMEHIAQIAPRRQGEYYMLLLFSITGMCLLAGARNLVLLLVAFEFMSIPLYVMAAYAKTGPEFETTQHRNKPKWTEPAEGAFKLFIIAAVSAGITVYGLSLVYGATGSTDIKMIREASSSPLFSLGLVMLLVGFGFKLGAAPFHMWVPDTYQGAPTPFVSFLSAAPKAAAIAALAQILLGGALTHSSKWTPLLLVVIVGSLLLGNTLALVQSNTKRLLAFSGVAQIGFPLMALVAVTPTGVASGQTEGLAAGLFYLAAYVVANMGLFLVIEVLETAQPHRTFAQQDMNVLSTFAGLGKRAPGLAMAALLFLLSLAGIPFVVGFWAKLYVFLAVWQAGYGWLVVLGAVLSVVGLFYYLRIARAIYMDHEPERTKPLSTPTTISIAIGFCLAATVITGLYPNPLIEAARQAAQAFLLSGG
ncbi:MAG: NADH-quinone oxidoreductase subunit N [Myxococcota bacterium]|nr:NADH-quinone oxidoreductase subunit N [Myxococcota bacterium]